MASRVRRSALCQQSAWSEVQSPGTAVGRTFESRTANHRRGSARRALTANTTHEEVCSRCGEVLLRARTGEGALQRSARVVGPRMAASVASGQSLARWIRGLRFSTVTRCVYRLVYCSGNSRRRFAMVDSKHRLDSSGGQSEPHDRWEDEARCSRVRVQPTAKAAWLFHGTTLSFWKRRS
jgi:hypothetical protein